MCLVVNKETRLPGKAFYEKIGRGDADLTTQRVILDREIEHCRNWSWQ
jgi:hypothetical protein